MIDLLIKKLMQLIETLIEPIFAWVLQRNWAGRLAASAALLLALFFSLAPERAVEAVRVSLRTWRVARTAPPAVAIANPTLILASCRRIAQSLAADLADVGSPGREAWATSQATVATYGLKGREWDSVAEYLVSSADPACCCWKEIPTDQYPENIVASAWVLFALARLDRAPTECQISFLLNAQSPDGWWSVFPVDPKEAPFASTYASAWALLALDHLMQRNLVPSQLHDSVDLAIERGTGWLLASREPGTVRWKNYPLSPQGEVSLSLSGLAVHTLHVANRDHDLADLDAGWINSLPRDAPGPSSAETVQIWIDSKVGRHADHFVQVELPWLIVATVDAYQSSDLLRRTLAVSWLEHALSQPGVDSSERLPSGWWRSELLVALRYLVDTNYLREPPANLARGE